MSAMACEESENVTDDNDDIPGVAVQVKPWLDPTSRL